MRAPLREPAMIRIGEQTPELVLERLEDLVVAFEELGRPAPRTHDEVTVPRETSELQIRKTGLARAEQLALAPDLQVDLGELETVRDLDERLEPPFRFLGQLLLGTRHEEAVRLLGAAADPAAQLVQLGKPEAVCFLHDHDRRVREVDADFDHRCRDEDVQFAPLESIHDGAPLTGPQPAVQTADAEVAQLTLLQ